MEKEFNKSYSPKEFEWRIYNERLENKKFEPQKSKTGKTFYIPVPPPNVTWVLHLWHALTLTLEDIMIRYHRLKWDETLWVPGTDHAWIATQSVVEKKLAKEWITRQQLGREKFLQKVWEWKDEYASNISNQSKLMWASLDWSKERFTLDKWLSDNVGHIFCDLYNKWLIYRWEYMVNYSPALETVVSDIEVDYVEEEAKMYYITYFVSWSDNELIIATTRPETLLADQAIAVHPKDKRYKKMIWRSVILPIVNKEIPIIWDETVERDFGTWVLKITPAHDPADFQLAKRHNLRLDYSVIDKNWRMTKEAWIFAWQDFMTARENIVELLRAKWNLIKIEPYIHKVGYCSRGWCKIETIISKQWFVKSSELAKKVIAWYKKKEFVIVPERYNKTFEDWIFNLRDWCISRQLWWWHQIPAYFDVKTGELLEVTLDEESVYKKYWKENIRRDEDVLDTWFSAALWPFSILDWNDKNPSELFKKFYPANVLETWHDILTFWVIKMLLMWYEYTWETPFKTIYLHWLVRDEQGRKMSKSIWNWINPIDVINEFSADALRLTLVIGNTPWNNMNFSMKNVENYSIFLNKLWNITRFVYTSIWEITEPYAKLQTFIEKNYEDFSMHEKWIISRLSWVIENLTIAMEKYNFSMAWEELISFTKDEFADFFIEEYKLTKDVSKYWKEILSYCILSILKLFHPYISFVTEELYSKITPGSTLIDSEWPGLWVKKDVKVEKNINTLYEIIRVIRNIRAEKWIKPWNKVDAIFRLTKANYDLVNENILILKWLAKLENIEIIDKTKKISNEDELIFWVVWSIEIFINPWDAIDYEEEKNRLKTQINNQKDYINKLDLKLLNAEFLRNAPEHVVRMEQDKKTQAQEQLQKLIDKLSSIK